MKDFRKLLVWQKAHKLTLAIYKDTLRFPREELFGITSQMRRASASIAANLAEGCGREGDGDFHRFLNIAAGSALELEYFVLLARDLGLLPLAGYDDLRERVVEIERMLAGLLRTLAGARQNTTVLKRTPQEARRSKLAARSS